MAQQNLWRMIAWYATDDDPPEIDILIERTLFPASNLPDARAVASEKIDTAYSNLLEPDYLRSDVQANVTQLTNNV